jgi:sulfur carrier protein
METSEQRTLIVNGEEVVTAAANLAALVAERGLADARVATALNGEFVANRARDEAALNSGDHVEIVSPRHGG